MEIEDVSWLVDTVADVTVVVITEVIVDKGDTPPVIRVQHKAT